MSDTQKPTSRLTEPEETARYSVRVPNELDEKVGEAIDGGVVPNQSEGVRAALRQWDGETS